ncbi:MAG: hypothetical protein FWC50_01500 [Planctomycetaceae bacterium]|nr:hypothetical protein [Planctomycetaceae bacterium]
MFHWSKEKMLILGVVLLLLGAELMVVQRIALTRDATVFLARQTNHPQLAAAQTIDQLTGTNNLIQPLQFDVWIWWGRIAVLVGFGMVVRHFGKE